MTRPDMRSERLAAERFAQAQGRHAGGQVAEAEALYRAALDAKPEHLDALGNLAALSAQSGRFDEAMTLCRRALALKPDFVAALNTLGIVLKRLGRTEDAVACYREALACVPDDTATLGNLGLALRALGRHDEALAPIERAARLQPTLPSAQLNRGNALKALGRLDGAEAAYREAVALDADYAEAHSNLGSLLRDLGRPDEAEAELEAALRLNSRLLTARYNLANPHRDRGRLEAATTTYREVLRLDPDFAPAHWNLSHVLLLSGRLDEGFAEYEWRWRLPAMGQHGFSGPQWDGAAEPGAQVIVHAEQGFGDAIQFARYVPLIAARGHPVTLLVRAPLRRLFSGLQGIDVVTELEPGRRAGYHCPMLSLPGVFGTMLANIPGTAPYLAADAAAVMRWRARLAGDRLAVGVAWRGNPTHIKDRTRSLDPALLRPLFELDRVRLVSL